MGKTEDDYPGKGTPWFDYLHHRARVIVQFRDEEGKSWDQIARELSMDPMQVRLIHMSFSKSEEGTAWRRRL